MDRSKLYKSLISNNPIKAAQLTSYKNRVAQYRSTKK